MIRALIGFGIRLLANALGLIAASLILSGFSITGVAFVIAVLIFTVVEVVVDPMLTQMANDKLPALRGGVALITTFVGLLITSLASTGLQISGVSTWLAATLIVWLAALIAGLILPLILVKKAVAAHRENKAEQ